jgi:hypothetical protein
LNAEIDYHLDNGEEDRSTIALHSAGSKSENVIRSKNKSPCQLAAADVTDGGLIAGGLITRSESDRERRLLAFATEEDGLELILGPLGLKEQPPLKVAEKCVRGSRRQSCIAQIFSVDRKVPRPLVVRPVAHEHPFETLRHAPSELG